MVLEGVWDYRRGSGAAGCGWWELASVEDVRVVDIEEWDEGEERG